MGAWRCLFQLAVLGALAVQPVHAQQPVALELVLAIDASTSVDAAEFELQKHGLSQAFQHSRVIEAIEATGLNGIAVSLVQWAGPGRQRRAVDWMVVKDVETAARFSRHLQMMPRLVTGFTDAGGAIRFSVSEIETNAFSGQRRVIDVSGDGTSGGVSTGTARDEAVRRGVVVNGLAIHSEEYDLGALANVGLENFYRTQIIGGAGSFLMIADDFSDFATAIRKKLIREISGALLTELQHNK